MFVRSSRTRNFLLRGGHDYNITVFLLILSFERPIACFQAYFFFMSTWVITPQVPKPNTWVCPDFDARQKWQQFFFFCKHTKRRFIEGFSKDVWIFSSPSAPLDGYAYLPCSGDGNSLNLSSLGGSREKENMDLSLNVYSTQWYVWETPWNSIQNLAEDRGNS